MALISAFFVLLGVSARGQGSDEERFPLFHYLHQGQKSRMVTYAPSQLDPRNEGNQHTLKTSSLRADLVALRPVFDGLVLYAYHEACTPRILALAKELKFKAVILGVWDIKSRNELRGIGEMTHLYAGSMAMGVLLGNEGLNANRYETEDLTMALESVRSLLPAGVPVGTSEPLYQYQNPFVRGFGDFLAPNIHPVFDRPNMNANEAAAWVREEARKLAQTSGKPVFVKETGFPHEGKPQYTENTQSDFWAAYLKPGVWLSEGKGWVYHGVLFEAFDLPWKSEASGLAMERSWGLFSKDRKPYPALSVVNP